MATILAPSTADGSSIVPIGTIGRNPILDRLPREIEEHLGWQGPWGTTYASNLRSVLPQPRPPMPWFNVRAMSNQDLLAIHAYVKSLGASDAAVPAFAPPAQKVAGPVIVFPN